jgi:hypothetical protein
VNSGDPSGGGPGPTDMRPRYIAPASARATLSGADAAVGAIHALFPAASAGGWQPRTTAKSTRSAHIRAVGVRVASNAYGGPCPV